MNEDEIRGPDLPSDLDIESLLGPKYLQWLEESAGKQDAIDVPFTVLSEETVRGPVADWLNDVKALMGD